MTKENYIGMFRCEDCNEEESREPEKRKKALKDYVDSLKKSN